MRVNQGPEEKKISESKVGDQMERRLLRRVKRIMSDTAGDLEEIRTDINDAGSMPVNWDGIAFLLASHAAEIQILRDLVKNYLAESKKVDPGADYPVK